MKNKFSFSSALTSISRFYRFLITSKSIQDEDIKRRILILNILLLVFLVLAVSAQIIWLSHLFSDDIKDVGSIINVITPGFFIVLVCALILMTRKGWYRLSAWIFIILLILANIQTSMVWGDNVPSVIAIYALILFISGIVIGPKTAIFIMLTISIIRIILFYLHDVGIVQINTRWNTLPVELQDILIINFIYLVVSVASWLSSRELFKSFNLVLLSERKTLKLAKKLEKQNFNLEKIVDKRTKELRENQLKQLTEISSLAELGKLSAGLLHDIKNPLTVISMNLDSLKECTKKYNSINKLNLESLIHKSLKASKWVELIIKTSQKQLGHENKQELFELNQTIKNTLLLLECRANKLGIKISFKAPKKIKMMGYPVKFSRVIANLVMNSIDALEKAEKKSPKIQIFLNKDKKQVEIKVIDNGIGIKDSIKEKIFEPMFSTKKNDERAGLGLNISQEIIKNYFNGKITFKSDYTKGSEFLIQFPFKINENKKSIK